jgi:hypothetical protein
VGSVPSKQGSWVMLLLMWAPISERGFTFHKSQKLNNEFLNVSGMLVNAVSMRRGYDACDVLLLETTSNER